MRKMYRFLLNMVIVISILVCISCNNSSLADEASDDTSTSVMPTSLDDRSMPSKYDGDAPLEEHHTDDKDLKSEIELDESKYLQGGIFYPKEYARELGYTIYDSTDVEDHFSIEKSGIDYFVIVAWDFCGLFYEKEGSCHAICLYDRIAPDPAPTLKTATGDCIDGCTDIFIENEQTLLSALAFKSDFDPTLWRPNNVSSEKKTYRCSASYSEDGFIRPWDFQNEDESKYCKVDYYPDQ